jgi:hypothetical protein
MNKHGYGPVKVYLQTGSRPDWPMGSSLLISEVEPSEGDGLLGAVDKCSDLASMVI